MTQPTSNTIVVIPNSALYPGEGEYFPLLVSNTTQELFTILTESGFAGIFVNPMSANIANTANVVTALIERITAANNTLTAEQKASLLYYTNTTPGKIVFAGAPANTSVVEIRYNDIESGNNFITYYVATGAQTEFDLADNTDPDPDLPPSVYVNGVYQSNAAFGTTARVYGLKEWLDEELLAHTNRLSGLEQSEFFDKIDLQRILSTGIALNTLTNGLDGDSVYNSNNVMYCMSSLFCSSILKTYRDIINNEIMVGISGNVSNVVLATSQLSAMVNGVSGMIESDIAFFHEVENQLKYSTMANFIQSVYAEPSGRYIIKELIGNATLKRILE